MGSYSNNSFKLFLGVIVEFSALVCMLLPFAVVCVCVLVSVWCACVCVWCACVWCACVCVCVCVCVMRAVTAGRTVLGLACDCRFYLGFLTCIL